MCGARRATGNLRLRRDGNADAGTRRRDARLQNRIDVVNIIPVRGNILLCKRQNLRQASRGRFENGEQIFARPQQVAILDGRRNGDAACVENAIAFGCIDAQQRIHGRIDFFGIALRARDGRVHEGHGFVRTSGGVGTYMSSNHDVALQNVAAYVHLPELGGNGQGGKRAVPVGREADESRTSAEPAETADNAEGRSIASGSLAVSTGNEDVDKVRGFSVRADGFRCGVPNAPVFESGNDGFARDTRVVKQVQQIQQDFHCVRPPWVWL